MTRPWHVHDKENFLKKVKKNCSVCGSDSNLGFYILNQQLCKTDLLKLDWTALKRITKQSVIYCTKCADQKVS